MPTSLALLNSFDSKTISGADPATFYRYTALAVRIVLFEVEKIVGEMGEGGAEESETYKKLRDDPGYMAELSKKLQASVNQNFESENLDTDIWTGTSSPVFEMMEPDMSKVSHCGNGVHVLAENGDGVSASFGTTKFFGAGFASESTGAIFNSAMYNFKSGTGLKSGDRLLSSLSSLTVLDEAGNLRLQVAGVGGGLAGLTGAVFATYRHLWLKELPYEAVSHAVVIPNIQSQSLNHESKMDKATIGRAWKAETVELPDSFVFGVDMIARVSGKVKKIYAYVDRRKGEDAFASGR